MSRPPASAPVTAEAAGLPRHVPPLARLVGDRGYYGWYVAVACGALMFVGVGVGYYGLAVYLRPLQEEHGWSNSAVSGATSLYFVISGLVGALVGGYIDRNGPMRLMLVGFLSVGVFASLIGYVQELWHLYLLYTLLAVGFGLGTNIAVNSILTRWFVRRRARAIAISSTGVSLGGVVLTPLGSWLVETGGLQLATPVLGLLVLAVALPALLLVIAWDPRQMGLPPDGRNLPPVTEGALSEQAQRRVWRRSEVLRTVSFWAVLVAFVVVLMAQTGFVIHQIAFLEDRLGSRSAAAFALSTTAFGSIVARLVVGLFADALDKRWLTVGLFVAQGTAVLLVIHTQNVAATYTLTLVFGFTIGNVYMMQSLLVSEIFGIASFGLVFGLVAMASQVGSGVGPFAVGWLEDRTGGYGIPFTVTAIATYLAALAIVFARPVPPPAAEPAEVPAGRARGSGGVDVWRRTACR